jgi:hypothetical protein
MDHLTDDLPRLLTGDATRDEVLAAAEHLRACPDCQQDLVSAVVAHASLTSAQRFAPEVVAPIPSADDDGEDEPAGPLPDLSAVFARAREEAAATAPARSPRRRWRGALVAAAAAAVIGGATVAVVETTGSGGGTSGTTVALAAFHQGHEPARATIRGRTMHVDADRLPRLTGGRFYEVWLTDRGRTSMWPLGAIGPDNTAALPVPTSVMARYTAIEVSVQQANQTQYSGVSVLRGSYG